MQKGKNIVNYTATQLKAKRSKSATNFKKLDAITDKRLEKMVAEDERGLQPDWTVAELVLPHAKQSVHLRLEEDILTFFKSSGPGHISRMQAVLKAYADAHRGRVR